MNRKALYNLLGKYLDHTCTEEEGKMVDQWLELLQEDQSFAAYTSEDLEIIHHKIWKKIQNDTYNLPVAGKPIFSRNFFSRNSKWVMAASLTGILLFGALYLGRNYRSPALPQPADLASIMPVSGMFKQRNITGGNIKLIMEDSTSVVLEPNSTLNYPIHFSEGLREVYLEGKAFFNVSKNAKKPFFIYHNNLVTHVIGTSFFIDTKKSGKQVEISVITGRVEVSENARLLNIQKNQRGNGVVLTPNQKVIYSEDSRLFVSSIADKPLPLPDKVKENFRFENAPMATVLESLSKDYAIEIVVENEGIQDCTFTGDISRQELYSKLDLICKSINCSYEIKGTMILIKGEGCD